MKMANFCPNLVLLIISSTLITSTHLQRVNYLGAVGAVPVDLPPLVVNFTNSLFSALHGRGNSFNSDNHLLMSNEPPQAPPLPPIVPISEFMEIPPNPDPILEHRRRFVVNMTRQAWTAYAKASWGEAELHPLSSASKNKSTSIDELQTPKNGKSIFAALSTLWVMGLTGEFTQGVEWIDKEMNTSLVAEEGLWEVPGALLSLYALTGNGFFLTKARGVAEKFAVGDDNLWGYTRLWTSTRLEYRYLTDLTSNLKFIKQIAKVEKILNGSGDKNAVAPDDETKLMQSTGNSLMILLKSYLQSGGTLSKPLKNGLYDVLERLQASGYISTLNEPEIGSLSFIKMSPSRPTMYNWHCLLGAILTLSGEVLPQVMHFKSGWPTVDELHHIKLLQKADHLLQLGANLTETCHRVSASTPTGLPLGQFKLVVTESNKTEAVKGNSTEKVAHKKLTIFGNGGYWLSSQLAETYFLLFRLSGDRKYQEYAWQLAQAIFKHAKVPSGGFAEVAKVDKVPVERYLDRQPAEFLSGTLKYLYLTFAPTKFMSLRQWVFNAYGHPLPVCGQNWAYPGGVCGSKGIIHEDIAIV